MSDGGPVVVNSGPLIALSGVGHLDLLRQLHGSILVPRAVFREVSVLGEGRPGAVELVSAPWIQSVDVEPPPEGLLAEELGEGEAEVITLGVRVHADLILIDDRKARRIAEIAYGLRVRGTAGTLVVARRRGLLPAVRPVLEAMRTRGYYLSSRLLERACREVGE
jgi:predicted nucleic acid-binding protein